MVAQYLGIGDDEAEISPFQRRTSIAVAEKLPEEDIESRKPLRNSSKRRHSTAPPKPAKKAKGPPKKLVSESARTSQKGVKERVPSVIRSSADELANIQELIFSSETYAPSEQTLQRLGAWMYQPSSSSSSNASLVQSSIRESIRATISVFQPVSNTLAYHNAHNLSVVDGLSSKSDRLQPVHLVIATPQPEIGSTNISPLRGKVLETIPEESSPPLDVTSQRERVFQHNKNKSILPTNKCLYNQLAYGTTDIPVDLTYNMFGQNGFDGISDDDLIHLSPPVDLSSSIQSVQYVTVHPPSIQYEATTLQTPQPSDPVLSSPIFHDIDQYDLQGDWIDDKENDLLDMNDDIVDTITLAAPNKTLPRDLTSSSQPNHPSTILTPESDDRPRSSESPEQYVHSVVYPPIVRPSFRQPIRDRSLLIGVSATTYLRTCFRIGEAINSGCTAIHSDVTNTSSSILIEVYAKIMSSYRDESRAKQHFLFADLFHEAKPPFLNGVCDCWKGSELWEYDCRRLLTGDIGGEKKLCRAIGRMKREGSKWQFMVLNIWEATWDDIQHVSEIICFR
jgi:hypothetical protein